MIHRLSPIDGFSIWPFQTPAPPVVLAEVYPSLVSRAIKQALMLAGKTDSGDCGVKDQMQVRILARCLFELSRANRLSPLLHTPAGSVRTEEGWILGAGHMAALEGALR